MTIFKKHPDGSTDFTRVKEERSKKQLKIADESNCSI